MTRSFMQTLSCQNTNSLASEININFHLSPVTTAVVSQVQNPLKVKVVKMKGIEILPYVDFCHKGHLCFTNTSYFTRIFYITQLLKINKCASFINLKMTFCLYPIHIQL